MSDNEGHSTLNETSTSMVKFICYLYPDTVFKL